MQTLTQIKDYILVDYTVSLDEYWPDAAPH